MKLHKRHSRLKVERRLSAIADDAKARIDRAKEVRKLQKAGLKELQKDLDEMIERLAGPETGEAEGRTQSGE